MSEPPWASYQIRKISGCACAGNTRNVFPRRWIQWKPRISDPGMHHGTCGTHVPWYMSRLLTRGGGENVPGIPGACAPAILRIWQEAHGTYAVIDGSNYAVRTLNNKFHYAPHQPLLCLMFHYIIFSTKWWHIVPCLFIYAVTSYDLYAGYYNLV